MTSQEVWVSDIWKRIKDSGSIAEDDTAIIFYSSAQLQQRLAQLKSIFGAFKTVHTVAVKTNPHKYILRQIVAAGFGLEAASFEEVRMAVEAGAPFDRITYNSPVKTHREITYCEKNYPGLRLNVNSLEELDRLSSGNSLNVGLRINPLVNAGSNELYNVSGEESKFGVPIDQRSSIVDQAIHHHVNTLHLHVGSQVGDIAKVADAIAEVVSIAEDINSHYTSLGEEGKIKTINIGGGLPAGKDMESSFYLMEDYVKLIQNQAPLLINYQVVTEFGQWVHKHNGVTFSQVEYIKKLARKSIAYVHVGADLFMREAYTSMNTLQFTGLRDQGEVLGGASEIYDIAGPLCFNGDYLGKDQRLPQLRQGDILAIPSSGANAYGLWSRHCSRTIPAMFTDDPDTGRVLKVAERQYIY